MTTPSDLISVSSSFVFVGLLSLACGCLDRGSLPENSEPGHSRAEESSEVASRLEFSPSASSVVPPPRSSDLVYEERPCSAAAARATCAG